MSEQETAALVAQIEQQTGEVYTQLDILNDAVSALHAMVVALLEDAAGDETVTRKVGSR